MGRQVGYFADEIDEAALLEHADAIGLRAVSEPPRAGGKPRLTSAREAGVRSRASTLLLARADLPLDRITLDASSKSRLGLTAATHPLIALSRSPAEKGGVVRNGRIYFESREDEETGKLYERLARFIRRWPKADRHRFFVGPHTADAARTGQLHLMHHREELHPT